MACLWFLPMMVPSSLPVSQAGAVLHDGRAFVNGTTVGKPSSAVIGPVAFLAQLLAAQVTVEVAALALVLQDVQVDPFVADENLLLLRHPEADLLRAPILAEQALDQAPVCTGDTWPDLGITAANRQLVGLRGPVTFQTTIAPQLPADRGFVDADDGSNL